uniref:Uncharacterized protein n=1 Tax=Ditylenchus dipsaci TaxID=166011 RepID=A0A915D560_9BILA
MSIAYKLPIILLILLFQLNAYHHLPLPTLQPQLEVLIRLDPTSLDDISSDVLLTGWHTCSIKKPPIIADWQVCGQIGRLSKPVVFKNTGKESDISQIPLVSSPKERSGDAILPSKWAVLWKESSIKVRPNTGVRCETTKLSYLGGASMDWRDGQVDWIRFGWEDNTAQVFWNLSKTSDPEAVSKT